jgi:hypothetical protein
MKFIFICSIVRYRPYPEVTDSYTWIRVLGWVRLEAPQSKQGSFGQADLIVALSFPVRHRDNIHSGNCERMLPTCLLAGHSRHVLLPHRKGTGQLQPRGRRSPLSFFFECRWPRPNLIRR